MVQVEGNGDGFFRGRFVWMVLSATVVTILVIVLFQYVHCREQLANAKRERAALLAKLTALQNRSIVSGGDIGQLEEDLAADLMRHRELIPYKGVMGGAMGFYSKKDIHILSERWVMASFEDGHIGGHMLLEYVVSPRGEIQWKVISAYLD